MLGRLRMAVDECIDAYVSLSDRIFQKQRHRVTIKGRVQGRFDSDELERAIKEIVTRQGLAENVLLKDAPNAKCKVCQGFGKELTNLAKMYTEDNKYSGEDDNFDFKFTIFYDLCSRADVPQEAKVKAYPTMLRGLALDHYYTNLKNVTMTLSFNQICDATRHYFEGPEYRRGILGQWNSITLRSVMSKGENTGKSTLDCLQLLIKELKHLQHGLDLDLRTNKFLHNKLINAC
jgi:hypothetical protein